MFYIDFFKHWLLYCKIDLWTDKLTNKSLRELPLIFVSSLVSKLYQTMSICTMTLESVCKIYPRRWHLNGNSYSTQVYIWTNYSGSRYLIFIPIFWNVLIWLKYDFMHTCTSLCAIFPSVLWHIIFETTAQIPEVYFGGKYGYTCMRANTGIWGQMRIPTFVFASIYFF